MKKKIKRYEINKNNGITLITLVVTIIVLLILASVSIVGVFGDNGLLQLTKKENQRTQQRIEEEQIEVSYEKYKTKKTIEPDVTLTVRDAIVTGNATDGWEVEFDETGNIYKINPNGEIEEKLPEVEPTDIYVTLYTDGTLGFSNNKELIEGKEVLKSYENIKGMTFSYDSNNKVANTPWYNDKEKIKLVNFANEIVPTSTAYLFRDCNNLTQVENIKNLNTSQVTSMRATFAKCVNLNSLDLSSFNTNKVNNMVAMFEDCLSLTSIDVSSFNTSRVTAMNYMFGATGSNIMALREIKGLEKLITSNVTGMSGMFYNCSNLTNIDVNSFNTSKVTDMSFMFYGCSNLTELDIKKFETGNVQSMKAMFDFCSKMIKLDLSTFDTSNVTDMSYMFYGCERLTELNLDNFDTSMLTDMTCMFYSCQDLVELDLTSFNTRNVTNMSSAFEACYNLKVAYGREDRWITTNVSNSNNEWLNCKTNHITFKTYIENGVMVGYELVKGQNWSGNVAKTGGDYRRVRTKAVVQFDPTKTYTIQMKNLNYQYGYILVDLDMNNIGGINYTSEVSTVTGIKNAVFNLRQKNDQAITDSMLNEIMEAFEIRLVEK